MDRLKMNDSCTQEQLIEALEKTRGFIHAAKRYLASQFGLNVSAKRINEMIQEHDLSEWLHDTRVAFVSEAKVKKAS